MPQTSFKSVQLGRTQSWASEVGLLSIQHPLPTSPFLSHILMSQRVAGCPGPLISPMHPESKPSDLTFLGWAQQGNQKLPLPVQTARLKTVQE